MRHYELVLILHPDQQDQVEGILNRLSDNIRAGGGVVHRLENWGRRQLAYPIAKVHKAIYVLMNIEVPQETFDDLNATLRFNDAIIRKLIVTKNESVTKTSKIYEETLATQEAERAREKKREDDLRRRQEERQAAARAEALRNGEGVEAQTVESASTPAATVKAQADSESATKSATDPKPAEATAEASDSEEK